MTAWAIVVAAGDGTRLGAAGPKALVSLGGRPMLAWSIEAALAAPSIAGIVVACGESWIDQGASLVSAAAGDRGRVCRGGASRHASVREALRHLPGDADRVVVHDAARPLAGPDLFERALAALDDAPGAICAIPVADTVKRVDGGVVAGTLDRSVLWRAQTPQAFRLADLIAATAGSDAADATDEAVLLERAGKVVAIVQGDERNIKVTGPADLAMAEALVAAG